MINSIYNKLLVLNLLKTSNFKYERVTKNGVSSVVYRIKSRERTFYLKQPKGNSNNYKLQSFISNQLRKQQANIPTVLYFQAKIFPRMFQTEIKGSNTYAVIKNKEKLINDISLILNTHITGFGKISVQNGRLLGEYSNYFEYFSNTIERSLSLLHKEGLFIGIDKRQILMKYNKEIQLSKTLTSGRLVHGDLPGHILFKQNTYTGIIDFDDIKASLPYYDLIEMKYLDNSLYELVNKDILKNIENENFESIKALEEILFLIEDSYFNLQVYKEKKDRTYLVQIEKYYRALKKSYL